MADSKLVASFTLLKTELKRIFDEGLLLSSYNIYSQFMPCQMEAFILELVELEIAYHAGGLSNYELTKKWTELIWDVDELKRLLAEGKLHNNPMCCKFLLALEKQDDVAPRKGVRQIIRIYGTSPGNRHHDHGVQWRKIDVHMFKGTTEHVLTYFKCQDGKDAKEGEAGYATLMGTQSLTMNAEVSGSKAVNGFCFQHQFQGQSSEGAGISLVTDYASNFDAVALAEHHQRVWLGWEKTEER